MPSQLPITRNQYNPLTSAHNLSAQNLSFFSMTKKKAFQLINLTLFVFGAAFIVLHIEFRDGNFLYYFFKAKIYYSQYNKIIFPVGFWGCFTLFYAFNYLLNKTKEGHGDSLVNSLRYPLFYHLYLLLLSHSNEITQGLSSSNLSYAVYEKIFLAIAFVCYYLVGVNIIRKVIISDCRIWELIIPVSAIIPYLYLTSPLTHLSYLFFSLGLYGGWQFFDSKKLTLPLKDLITSDYFKIGFIFFLSLFFRLWYAYPYATFDKEH